jgi:hypothetical protein
MTNGELLKLNVHPSRLAFYDEKVHFVAEPGGPVPPFSQSWTVVTAATMSPSVS